jgi:Uma2 family endonuclease
MKASSPRHLIRLAYEKAAEEYLRSLPKEHFMEATPQGTQRKITLESFDLVSLRRPSVQAFNELLVQYPLPGYDRPRQVVPDNMVLDHDEPIQATGSFDVPLQPAKPFWVLEYVSKYSVRKDYEDNFVKYEQELKVPYYLTFYPDVQEMTLYHLKKKKYVAVVPNGHGRCPVPELEMEVGLLDGWVRFWHQGKLTPLPADLQREVDQLRGELLQQQQRADQEARRADKESERADQEHQARLLLEKELAQLRAQLTESRKQSRKRRK